MAGVSVFQDSPDNLKSLQYGSDGTSVRVLKLDTNGRQVIATDDGTTVEISAKELDIRNLTNTQDNIVVYGNDGADNKAIRTDTSGRQIIATDIGTSVEVSATYFDIRNLSNVRDNIVVYGSDGIDNRALKTDAGGILQVAATRAFTSQSQTVTTDDGFAGSSERNISLQAQYSFFVNNIGANPAVVKVQISPDNALWIDDSSELSVGAAEANVVTPVRFANYARIAYKSADTGAGTTLDIIYQAQA